MAESKKRTFVNAVFMCFIACQVCKVKGNSCRYTNELIASVDPSVTTFKRSLDEPYDYMFQRSTDGLECTWTIQASSDDRLVRLNFITFQIMNDTATKNGDCVAIYDGDKYDTGDRQELIQELCSRMPEAVYNSTGQYLSVVFRQGDHGGLRWMTMNYTAVDSSDGTTLLGAVIAGLYMIVGGVFVVGVCILCKIFVERAEWCKPVRSLLRCCREGLSSLCEGLGRLFHSHETGSTAQIRRTSITLDSPPLGDSARDNTWSETISLTMSTDGEVLQNNPASPPPDYSSVVETPSCPQLQDPEPAEPTAPPMSLAPTSGDSQSSGANEAPPPSYESLFRGESSV